MPKAVAVNCLGIENSEVQEHMVSKRSTCQLSHERTAGRWRAMILMSEERIVRLDYIGCVAQF